MGDFNPSILQINYVLTFRHLKSNNNFDVEICSICPSMFEKMIFEFFKPLNIFANDRFDYCESVESLISKNNAQLIGTVSAGRLRKIERVRTFKSSLIDCISNLEDREFINRFSDLLRNVGDIEDCIKAVQNQSIDFAVSAEVKQDDKSEFELEIKQDDDDLISNLLL